MSGPGLLPLHALADAPRVLLPEEGEVVLGRDPGEDGVRIGDPRCSRRHATVSVDRKGFHVADLGSKNGTWVNGVRVEKATLALGDIVRIGHAEFAFGGVDAAYRCTSCLKTMVTAPPDMPFCGECKRNFPLLGATVAERRLIRGLGSGPLGTVYVGHRPGNPYVAMKVLHAEVAPPLDRGLQILKEACAPAAVDHERLVRFGDCGREADRWYLVLEYVPGHSLAQRLEETPVLKESEVLPIAGMVLDALEFVHGRGGIHGDLKPSNVLVNEEGQVKVADFGLALGLAKHGLLPMGGSPLFHPPERIPEGEATQEGDLYGLAATVYRALTGHFPVEARNLSDWMKAVHAADPPRARTHRPDLSEKIDEALAAALSLDPGARPTSAAALRRLLKP